MELSLKRCCRYALRFWWVIVVAALIGGMTGFIISMRDADYFRAEGELRVHIDASLAGDSYSEYSNAVIEDVIAVIENRDFLTQQFDAVGASGLYTDRSVTDFVSATRNSDTSSVITVSCRTPDRNWSLGILGGILNELPGRVSYEVTVASSAQIVEAESSSSTTPVAIGVVAGAVIMFLAFIVASVVDGKIYWRDELEGGQVPLLGDLGGKKL